MLKVINQTILKQAPVIIYDIDIFWDKKEFGKFNVYSSPVDNSNDNILLVMNLNPQKDLFYAISHGVNRGKLKTGKIDSRLNFLQTLIKKLNGTCICCCYYTTIMICFNIRN